MTPQGSRITDPPFEIAWGTRELVRDETRGKPVPVRAMPCSTCGADDGQRCFPKGSHPHAARIRLCDAVNATGGATESNIKCARIVATAESNGRFHFA